MPLNQCSAKFHCTEYGCRKSEEVEIKVDQKCCIGGGEGAPTLPQMGKTKDQRPQGMVKDGWGVLARWSHKVECLF